MTDIFEPFTINNLVLSNRFVRSATMDSMADNGKVSDAEMRMYRQLAEGEIGLIVSHGLYPTKEGQASPGQLSVHTDEAIPSLSRLTRIVHDSGGKIVAQILHGGWLCRPEVTRTLPVGPSATVHPRTGQPIRELSTNEVYQLVDDYVQAARRIIEAGFDGIQLHGAHSWLLSAFLSPATNHREDEWGGSPEKRSSFVRTIYHGIRQMAGPDYPLMIKLGLKDYHPQGKTTSEGIEQARILQIDGMDAIEISEGIEEDFFHHIRPEATNPYYVTECREARRTLSVPLILIGGMRILKDMQEVVESGVADAISMCRPFIMNPYLVRDLRLGLIDGSRCTSCNKCLGEMAQGHLRCVLT